jgi:hypothetical protein
MAQQAAKELHADLEIGDLGGSLLWGIHARRAILKPRPGAPFRAAEVERVDVAYGFLGSGEPSLRVDGVRFVLAPQEGTSSPIQQTVRDVLSALRSLRFPGSVAANNVEVVLPDGRRVKLQRGSLDHGTWSVTLETADFGTIEGAATLRPDGALTIEGTASEGILRSAKLELGPGDQCPLKIAMELEGHPLQWTGTAWFSKGQIDRVDGELLVKEGRARTRVDFLSGRVEADVDAVVAVDEEFKGDLAITAHAEGPMAGPKEAWTLREGRVRAKNAKIESIVVDDAEVTLGSGSLAKITFKAKARRAKDEVQAEGSLGWNGKPEVEARIVVAADDLAPYLAALKKPLPLRCSDIRADGMLLLRSGALSFDGSSAIGRGDYSGIQWEHATFRGSLSAERVIARQLDITKSKFASAISLSGSLEGDTLGLKFQADHDQGELGGRFNRETGDLDGTLRLEGPMTWLERGFGISLPKDILPIVAEGKVRRQKEDATLLLNVSGKNQFLLPLSATIRQSGDDWIVAVSPGTVRHAAQNVSYEAFTFSLTKGKASLENLKLTSPEAELTARLSGSATWNEKETRLIFRISDTSLRGAPVDPLFAQLILDRGGDALVKLHWGKDEGDHLRIEGKWGEKDVDLTAQLRAGDLKRPLVKYFLRSAEIEGSIAADAHVSGTAEEPRVTGTINLSKISAAGLPPLSLVIPLEASGRVLRFWSVAEKTPYGSLTIEGTLPLPGSGETLNLSAKLSTDDLSFLTGRMTPQARVWIPRGGLMVEAGLRGSWAKPELIGRAEFFSFRWKPPPPLPEARDIRVSARLDANGIGFEMVDGLLGEGPFWASGRFDLFRPGTPLSLWITARDALAVSDPLARLRVRPDVMLTWTQGDYVKLSGRIEIPLAIYHREFVATTPGGRLVARQVSAPKLRLIPGESGGFLIPGIEGLEGLELDLQFVTTGEFRIENSVVGVLLQAEGQFTGTAAEPALSGKVRALPHRGEVKLAPGNFLRIDSAEATLSEELGRAPTVRFEGSVGAGEGMITVHVEGPLDNPSLTLKSDPPQSQKDLLGKLAFGLGSGEFSKETGVATLAVYVYSQTQDAWPSADRKEGFFDRFRPNVVANDPARRMPWELPPQGMLRSTALRTEYVINSYISVIAETNREGDVAGDLKLRIRF